MKAIIVNHNLKSDSADRNKVYDGNKCWKTLYQISQEKITRSKLLNVFFRSAQAKTGGRHDGNPGSPDSTFLRGRATNAIVLEESVVRNIQ